MKLWIRSQDRERLIKVENLYVEFNGDVNPEFDTHRIVTDKFINLGIYKTKERALEVLDEIQNIINNNGIENEEYDKTSGCYYAVKKNIYEMPEK